MSQQLKVFIKNIGEYVPFTGGQPLIEIFENLSDRMPDLQPICALVNNKAESLSYPLFSPKQVEFLSLQTEEGRKTYVHTLSMMLYYAVAQLCPSARLMIEHSVASGYYCRLQGDVELTDKLIADIKGAMQHLVARDVPIVRKERLTKDVIEIFRRQGLDDKVRLLSTLHELYTVYYT
ncbi:MAG: nucleoside kinase, partial [Muribaculum sp.]|nr:nucleoside kinase [Muribaculum sp.]